MEENTNVKIYDPSKFGKKEEELKRKFDLQLEDAKKYFIEVLKPRMDRSYKVYMAYNGDREREIKKWQANMFVPYPMAVVETLMPRILDARPEFSVQARLEVNQAKSVKLQNLNDYTWEKARMDVVSEDLTRSSLIFGTGFLQAFWKKDERELNFLKTKDVNDKKYKYEKKTKVFYDAPCAEYVDNYELMYDWHNIPSETKQYWFKRKVITSQQIKRNYPMYDKNRLEMALNSPGDLTNYAEVRQLVKKTHEGVVKGDDYRGNSAASGVVANIYEDSSDFDTRKHEVYEWWRPFDDEYSVFVNDVPILKGGSIPNPYNFKEAPFIAVQFLKIPGEFEGVGLPIILENPTAILNMIKNQRIDATTLNIHKMWIVNPLANVNQEDLVTKPFGIIWSADSNAVKPVEFSDIKESAYREEESVKGDMRYASGVDDFSMGSDSGASSATAVRHLRESTLERVRLFVNHLGAGYGQLMRYWMEMYKQFFTKTMNIRINGEDGEVSWPLIEKDDLMGEFDYKASVIPSIAGKNDIDKKQAMDLYQLLSSMEFIDQQKLTSKVLHKFDWDMESLIKKEGSAMPGLEGLPGAGEGLPGAATSGIPATSGGQIPSSTINQAVNMLGGQLPEGGSQFSEASSPIDLLNGVALPPTAAGIGNTRGLNRGGKVDTNIPTKGGSSADDNIASQSQNLQS